MKTLKLTADQLDRLTRAVDLATGVLTEIKASPLEGEALNDRQIIARCVSGLDLIVLLQKHLS